MCAWAALRGGSGVMHAISACAVIGRPQSFQERREARTDDSPRARLFPPMMCPQWGRRPAWVSSSAGWRWSWYRQPSYCRGRLAPGPSWVSASPTCPVCRRIKNRAPAWPVLTPEYASRRLQAAQNRGTELNDEGPILPLDLATRSQDFDRRWVLVLGSAGVARGAGVGHDPIGSHPPPNATGPITWWRTC